MSDRPTIPASEIGVTLKVSEEALKEIERLKEERIKNAAAAKNLAFK